MPDTSSQQFASLGQSKVFPDQGSRDTRQGFLHDLVPLQDKMAVDFVHLRSAPVLLANGSMSSGPGGECPARSASSKPEAKMHGLGRQWQIRQALIEPDLVKCMVALLAQLFTNTEIPACIWFLTKRKMARPASRAGVDEYRDRSGPTFLIDVRKLGYMIDRLLRDFSLRISSQLFATS